MSLLTQADEEALQQSWEMRTMTAEQREVILRSRVAAGISLLDSIETDLDAWYVLVDADTLNIGDSYRCVLGQLFGDYASGLDALSLHIGLGHGFAGDYYRELTAIWREEILKRQGNDV